MNPDIPQEVRIVNAIAEQLFDVWPVSIVMIDLEDRIWRMNKQMSDELQQDADIIGKPVVDMLEVVQDRENVLPRYLQDLHEGRQSIIHLSSNCFMLEPKRHISFLIQGALMGIYEENRLVRIVLYYRNVLEESTRKHLLNIALSRTQIFQWSYDMERNLMIIDPRYFEYLGIPTRDYTLTPEEFAYLMHPDDRQSVFDALTLQLDGSLYEAPVEYRLRRDDGSWEWFEAQSTYVGQLKETPFRVVGICMSTQKYKDTEERLNEALRKARRSDELKSIFLANMSHEIRTPLNAIVGFSSLLAETDEIELRQAYMSLVQENNELLLNLISDILDISKIEAGTIELTTGWVDVPQLCREVIATFSHKKHDGAVELRFDESSPQIMIDADKNRIMQVLSNFMTNALKFTTKGSITLSYTLNDDGQVRFCVTDTGKGIPAEQCHDIFNRFVKLDSFVQGAGLGLSICQSLVERMGGKIGVESCVGKGSCFWFTHPFTSATQSASTLVTENDMLATLQKKTVSRNYKPLILVAEDIDSNYLLIEALLKKDYRLVRAHNGSEVIELFNAETPDLILMDMKMPGISGIDTTTLLRKTGTQVPIVALTAFAYADDKSLAFDAGCNDFLTKPVSPPELRRVVSKWTVK